MYTDNIHHWFPHDPLLYNILALFQLLLVVAAESSRASHGVLPPPPPPFRRENWADPKFVGGQLFTHIVDKHPSLIQSVLQLLGRFERRLRRRIAKRAILNFLMAKYLQSDCRADTQEPWQDSLLYTVTLMHHE